MKKRLVVAISLALAITICFSACSSGGNSLASLNTVSASEDLYCYLTDEKNIVNINSAVGYVNNELIIDASEGTNVLEIEKIVKEYNAKIVGSISILNEYQVLISETKTKEELESIASELSKNDAIESVKVNYVFENDSEYTPNDSEMGSWDKKPKGNNWLQEAVDAPGSWEYKDKMTNAVNIGIIDSGFDETHEDLTFAEMPLGNANLRMQINNGKIKMEDLDHGTHCAGIAAADFDNKKGISGLCTNKKLYGTSLKGITNISSNKTSLFAVKASLVYLIHLKECKVISISQSFERINFCADREAKNKKFGTAALDYLENEVNKELEETLLTLLDEGHDFIICKSANNLNNTSKNKYKFFLVDDADKNNEDELDYLNYADYLEYLDGKKTGNEAKAFEPYKDRKVEIENRLDSGNVDAKYDMFSGITNKRLKSRIIVVGALQNDGNGKYSIANYSQCGSRVDVVAPGSSIFSCISNSKYDNMDGTSMATPCVAGIAGEIYSVNNEITGDKVKSIICSTTVGEYGKEKYGLVNAKSAVKKALAPDFNKIYKAYIDETIIPNVGECQNFSKHTDAWDHTMVEELPVLKGFSGYYLIDFDGDGIPEMVTQVLDGHDEFSNLVHYNLYSLDENYEVKDNGEIFSYDVFRSSESAIKVYESENDGKKYLIFDSFGFASGSSASSIYGRGVSIFGADSKGKLKTLDTCGFTFSHGSIIYNFGEDDHNCVYDGMTGKTDNSLSKKVDKKLKKISKSYGLNLTQGDLQDYSKLPESKYIFKAGAEGSENDNIFVTAPENN